MSKTTKQLIPTDENEYTLPIDLVYNNTSIYYNSEFKPNYNVVLSCNDVLEFLKSVPDEKFSLIVTSPPYNLGKPYERKLELDEYLLWQKKVINTLIKKLKPDGSICWQVGNYVNDKEVFPLDIYFYPIFAELGMKLRNRIIWHFGHGLHARTRFSGRYETILWFTKTDDYIFNLDPVRVPQKYPGKRGYKGTNKGKLTGNPKGKNPSDIWEVVVKDWEKELWNIPNVKSNHPEKTIHTSQYPIELVERLVLALTNEGDIVFDPFVGVGSSIIAALLHNRVGIGVDKEKAYTDIAYERIIEAISGTLKIRPLGKKIYKPSESLKLAQIPKEWNEN